MLSTKIDNCRAVDNNKNDITQAIHDRHRALLKNISKTQRENRLLERRGICFNTNNNVQELGLKFLPICGPQCFYQERKQKYQKKSSPLKACKSSRPEFPKSFSFNDQAVTCQSKDANESYANNYSLIIKKYRRPYFKSKLALEIQRKLKRDPVFATNLLYYTLLWHSKAINDKEIEDFQPSPEDVRRFMRWDYFFKSRKQCRENLINYKRDPLLLEKIYDRCYGRLINITTIDDPQLERNSDQQIPPNMSNSSFSNAAISAAFKSPMKPAIGIDLSMKSPLRRKRNSLGSRPLQFNPKGSTKDSIYAVFRSFQSELELFHHCATGANLAEQANFILKQSFEQHDIFTCVERDLEEGMTVELLVETKVKQDVPRDDSCSFLITEKVYGVATFVFLKEFIWLEHIAVPKLYQRQGLGSAFIKRLLEISVKRDLPILLFALNDAKPFYDKLGFGIASAFECQAIEEYEQGLKEGFYQSMNEKLGTFLIWTPPHKNRRRSTKPLSKLL